MIQEDLENEWLEIVKVISTLVYVDFQNGQTCEGVCWHETYPWIEGRTAAEISLGSNKSRWSANARDSRSFETMRSYSVQV